MQQRCAGYMKLWYRVTLFAGYDSPLLLFLVWLPPLFLLLQNCRGLYCDRGLDNGDQLCGVRTITPYLAYHYYMPVPGSSVFVISMYSVAEIANT